MTLPVVEARLRHGTPHMVDYKNTGAPTIKAGTVVVVGDAALICHVDIPGTATPNLTLGALAAGGKNATYQMVADGALAAGVRVHWDDTAKRVTATALGNPVMGYVAPHSEDFALPAADGDPVLVVHDTGEVG